jgi:hypothetical protein
VHIGDALRSPPRLIPYEAVAKESKRALAGITAETEVRPEAIAIPDDGLEPTAILWRDGHDDPALIPNYCSEKRFARSSVLLPRADAVPTSIRRKSLRPFHPTSCADEASDIASRAQRNSVLL